MGLHEAAYAKIALPRSLGEMLLFIGVYQRLVFGLPVDSSSNGQQRDTDTNSKSARGGVGCLTDAGSSV